MGTTKVYTQTHKTVKNTDHNQFKLPQNSMTINLNYQKKLYLGNNTLNLIGLLYLHNQAPNKFQISFCRFITIIYFPKKVVRYTPSSSISFVGCYPLFIHFSVRRIKIHQKSLDCIILQKKIKQNCFNVIVYLGNAMLWRKSTGNVMFMRSILCEIKNLQFQKLVGKNQMQNKNRSLLSVWFSF